jgi:hypothetical protein
LTDDKKVAIEFTKKEIEILINAAGSASPSMENEVVQFKLYHKLLFKLNEFK